MANNCPACGSPVLDDDRFCSHCGIKLPDNVKRVEIKTEHKSEYKSQYRYEDAAKLEEIRLRYEHEEKLEDLKRQEEKEKQEKYNRGLKKLCLISWSIAIICILLSKTGLFNEHLNTAFACFFMCGCISGLLTGINLLFKK